MEKNLSNLELNWISEILFWIHMKSELPIRTTKHTISSLNRSLILYLWSYLTYVIWPRPENYCGSLSFIIVLVLCENLWSTTSCHLILVPGILGVQLNLVLIFRINKCHDSPSGHVNTQYPLFKKIWVTQNLISLHWTIWLIQSRVNHYNSRLLTKGITSPKDVHNWSII